MHLNTCMNKKRPHDFPSSPVVLCDPGQASQPAALSLSIPSGNVTWEPLSTAISQTPVQTTNPSISSGEQSSHSLHVAFCCAICILWHILVPSSHQITMYHQLYQCISQTTMLNFMLRQPSSSTSYTLKTAPVFGGTQEQKIQVHTLAEKLMPTI